MAAVEFNSNAPISTPSTPSSLTPQSEMRSPSPIARDISSPEYRSRSLEVPPAFAHLPDFSDVGYILHGLCLPASLGRQAAVKIASAYADEQFKAYRADAEAAERRYQQQLLATQASKMHVLKLRRKLDQIARDASWFHHQAAGITSIEDPDWNAPSALLPTYYASSYDSGATAAPGNGSAH